MAAERARGAATRPQEVTLAERSDQAQSPCGGFTLRTGGASPVMSTTVSKLVLVGLLLVAVLLAQPGIKQ